MSDIENRTRQMPAGECPRCGDAFPKRATGRPAKWCSQRCRRAAYEERRAAARGVLAIELVRPVTTAKEHDLSECVSRVAASPTACRRVLQALTKLARSRDMVGDRDGSQRLTPCGDSPTRSSSVTRLALVFSAEPFSPAAGTFRTDGSSARRARGVWSGEVLFGRRSGGVALGRATASVRLGCRMGPPADRGT